MAFGVKRNLHDRIGQLYEEGFETLHRKDQDAGMMRYVTGVRY